MSSKLRSKLLTGIAIATFSIPVGAAFAEFTSGSTQELQNDKTCDGTGGILAYAETKDYKLYVCADLKENTRPRHYRSVNKNGTPGVSVTARTYNPNQGNYFEFFNGEYVYMIQIPSEDIKQPALVVEFPDGDSYEQKLTKFLISNAFTSQITNAAMSNK